MDMCTPAIFLSAAVQDMPTERLPFTIRRVDSEDSLKKAVGIRQAAYARHVPEFARTLAAVGAALPDGGLFVFDVNSTHKLVELHELKEGEALFRDLAAFGIAIEDYYLTQEESVSGEKLPTKYAIASDSQMIEVAGVGEILPEILRLGKQGIEVQRFKGLGEMNSEQLWETTLDPNRRTLLRVTLQDAAEAERMFSVLMGEDVERRRQFIEAHALEVKNLDV